MMRALFAAISGLRNHQLFMDVIGNNLANVNTPGFKSGRMTFSDLLSQTLRSGSPPVAGRLGGVNSQQIGLGSQVATIDVLQSQGALQSTGKVTDLAIQGDGFFILSDRTNGTDRSFFSRAGAFEIDALGNLVDPGTGLRVMGWRQLDPTTGKIITTGPIEPIVIPVGQDTIASATTKADFAGNLDSTSAIPAVGPPAVAGATAGAGITVVDSLGEPHTITITFTHATTTTWTWAVTSTDPAISSVSGTGSPITFGANGTVTAGGTGTLTVTLNSAVTGADSPINDPDDITLDFSKLTQLAALSEVVMNNQDGFTAGTLIAFRLGAKGEITGVYSNGLTKELGQLALASFLNPGGLVRAGQNLFEETSSSGSPFIGQAGSSGRGKTSSGTLESSNVDLSREFTNMIIGQRGFQSNARIVTTSDQMLEELVNLKR